ncbi:MAG TPA: creatininase family protein [Caldithrix abyssi]|uniref:Creatininase family protein n=1 Tax=Caldithrix abyssi TaxID=187145 RepID=A0A7V4TYX4_CALAY|nr:creatininase family protein [Caldithrix abyssi]
MSKIVKYEHITTFDLDDYDRERTLFVLPVSLLEEHGPHLPLGTDLLLAEALARRLAERIDGLFGMKHIVLMRGVPLGAGGIPMAGTIESDPQTVKQVVIDYGNSLAAYGFKYCLLSSGHAGSAHLQALQDACDTLQNKRKFNMIPVSNHVIEAFFNGRLIEKINSYLSKPLSATDLADFRIDSHAGWWETSAMLLEHESLVQDNYKTLHKSEQIGSLGYQGIPSRADKEFAEAVIQAMLDTAVEFLQTYLGPLS